MRAGFLFILLLQGLCFMASGAAAEHLTLAEAEKNALETSQELKASGASLQAAEFKEKAQFTAFLPKLSLEADFRYVSTVPKLLVGGNEVSLGDNENYSLGPALTYTVWDSGARRAAYRSLQKLSEFQSASQRATKEKVLFATRLAYIQTQLAQELLRIARMSLDVSRIQSRDIRSSHKNGAASRLDWLNAQAEVTNHEAQLAQSRGRFTEALVELAALVGRDLDEKTAFDDLEPAVKAAKATTLPSSIASNPRLLARTRMVASLESAVQGQQAGHWPVLQLKAQTSLDYPNGPRLEQIHQNTLLLNMSWNLWEWGAVSDKVAEKRAEAKAAEYGRDQLSTDLRKNLARAEARLTSLTEQQRQLNELVAQTESLAKLNYSAYKFGKLKFSEVQTANLRFLEAQMRQVQIDAQLLIQYQTVRYLASEGSSL